MNLRETVERRNTRRQLRDHDRARQTPGLLLAVYTPSEGNSTDSKRAGTNPRQKLFQYSWEPFCSFMLFLFHTHGPVSAAAD